MHITTSKKYEVPFLPDDFLDWCEENKFGLMFDFDTQYHNTNYFMRIRHDVVLPWDREASLAKVAEVNRILAKNLDFFVEDIFNPRLGIVGVKKYADKYLATAILEQIFLDAQRRKPKMKMIVMNLGYKDTSFYKQYNFGVEE